MKTRKRLVLKEKYQALFGIFILYMIIIIGVILINARLGQLG